jgi:hypothetical protein
MVLPAWARPHDAAIAFLGNHSPEAAPALAVDGGLGSDGALLDRPAVRRELAWAIAWSFEAGGGTAPPEESTRIEALSRRLGAPGLFRLLQVEPQPRERAR